MNCDELWHPGVLIWRVCQNLDHRIRSSIDNACMGGDFKIYVELEQIV